jgi:hypothetical protein
MSERAQGVPRIELHGWDSRAHAWHGPDELTYTLAGCRHILSKLRELPGSWYGRLHARDRGGLRLSFWASIHDLGDAGLAAIDMEGSPGSALEIILVVPAGRRAKLRPDLAFEFVSFLRFLEGPESLGSEMAVHDYIERTLHEAGEPATLVFSIQTRFVLAEVQIPIAEQAERLAMTMIAWLAEKDARQGASGTDGRRC